jgi:predicted metal-binding membrane protein
MTAERRLYLPLLGSVIALAWLTLWMWERSPYGRYLSHGELAGLDRSDGSEVLLRAGLYVLGWLLMTVAMMLPTVLPLLAIFRRLVAARAERAQYLTLCVLGYLGVWMAFGVVAHGADLVVHEATERIAWLEDNAWAIGAATLLAAGAFQFTALKYRCLDKCRTPLSFVMEHWHGRRERWNAFWLGAHHGIFCVGCCWALMLIMFGVGVGNVGWMLALGAVMVIEKNVSWGRRIGRPLGVALLAWGLAVALEALRWPGA